VSYIWKKCYKEKPPVINVLLNNFLNLSLQLDYKVTWKKLKDVFKLAGNVLRAEIKQDKEGKSRGIGTVTFEFPMEAVQAVCILNKLILINRKENARYFKKGSLLYTFNGLYCVCNLTITGIYTN